METTLMNKVNISNTNERSQDESDALTILQDAENIILASNEEKRKKIKKTYLCCIITILVLIILLLLFSTIFALFYFKLVHTNDFLKFDNQ